MKDAGKKIPEPLGTKIIVEPPRKYGRLIIIFIFVLAILALGAAGYLYKTGKLDFGPKWFVMGKDACAPINRDKSGLKTPQDVEENFICEMLDARKLYGAGRENLYVLNCRATLNMDLILIEGEATCKKTLDKVKGKISLAEDDGFGNTFDTLLKETGAKDISMEKPAEMLDIVKQKALDIIPSADPEQDWYVLTADNKCKLPTSIDHTAKTMTDFYSKFSCAVIQTQKLYGSAKPNFYQLHCPNYNATASAVFFYQGKSTCEQAKQAVINTTTVPK